MRTTGKAAVVPGYIDLLQSRRDTDDALLIALAVLDGHEVGLERAPSLFRVTGIVSIHLIHAGRPALIVRVGAGMGGRHGLPVMALRGTSMTLQPCLRAVSM